jgi:hypothetical protein
LAGFARLQYGIAPREQLRDAQLKRHHIDHLIEIGRLEIMFRCVYRVAGTPESWEQRVLGACWAGGMRGVASCRAAGALWDLPGGEQLLEITGPRWRRTRHEDIVAHESKHLDPLDVAIVKGVVPVTRPARTFLDYCGLVERGLLEESVAQLALQEAVRRDLVDIALVGSRWEKLGGIRRVGGRVAEKLIKRWLPGITKTDSRPEAVLLRMLHDHGLPDPVPQHRVWLGPEEPVDLDFAWPSRRVGLEFDSYRYHGGRMKHDADARRVLRLQQRRWQIVTVTDAELDAGLVHALPLLVRLLSEAAEQASLSRK